MDGMCGEDINSLPKPGSLVAETGTDSKVDS